MVPKPTPVGKSTARGPGLHHIRTKMFPAGSCMVCRQREGLAEKAAPRVGIFFVLPLAPCSLPQPALAHPQQHGQLQHPAPGGCWLSRPGKNQEKRNFPALKKTSEISNINILVKRRQETGERGQSGLLADCLLQQTHLKMGVVLLSGVLGEPLQRQDPCFPSLGAPRCSQHPNGPLNKPLSLKQGKGNPSLSQIPLHKHLADLVTCKERPTPNPPASSQEAHSPPRLGFLHIPICNTSNPAAESQRIRTKQGCTTKAKPQPSPNGPHELLNETFSRKEKKKPKQNKPEWLELRHHVS